MKQIITLIFIISLTQLVAQTDKDYILTSDFGYYYQHKDLADASYNATGLRNYGEKYNALTFNFSAGKKVGNHFYYGGGISYSYDHEEINPDSDTPKASGSSGYGTTIGYVNNNKTQNGISPLIFVQYFTDLSNRISFATDFYMKYTFNKIKTSSIYYQPGSGVGNYLKGNENIKVTRKQYISFGLQPMLRFTISKCVGMEFRFGLIEYIQKTKDNGEPVDKKTNGLEIGFKPENWLLGCYFRL